MTKQEAVYSLRKSVAKLGVLPTLILEDHRGEIIDGLGREVVEHQLDVKFRREVIPTKYPWQNDIIALALNGVRRVMKEAEIRQRLTRIAEGTGWSAREIAANIPFSYSWVITYLPDEFKHKEMAELGAKGGKAKAATSRVAKTKSEDSRQDDESAVDGLEEPEETDEEFITRFESTFKNHFEQVFKKDFPVIATYMDDDHNCGKCLSSNLCKFFMENLLLVIESLPECMKAKVNVKV